MAPFYSDDRAALYSGDCAEILHSFGDRARIDLTIAAPPDNAPIDWLIECRRLASPNGLAALFVDWRQVPAAAEALKLAAWTWRGITPCRSTKSVSECDYVVWGSAPPEKSWRIRSMPAFIEARGIEKERVRKPSHVVRRLLNTVPAGGTVLDPFMGAGSAGVEAVRSGLRFIGIERALYLAYQASERIAAAGGPDAPAADIRDQLELALKP